MDKSAVFLIATSVHFYISLATQQAAELVVRAVLINCESDDRQSVPFDNEAMRFEREELFKHSVLRDCHKKIALTVKIASDPDNLGDEYIPIEHVFQGPGKRVRLLNPYVLRLRREPPLQAYKLRKIDTVSGILSKDTGKRMKRNSQPHNSVNLKKQHKHCPNVSQENCDFNIDRPMAAYQEPFRNVIDDSIPERSINLNDISQSNDEVPLKDFKPIINEAVLFKTKKPKEPQPYEVKTKLEWPNNEPSTGYQINPNKQQGAQVNDDSDGEYNMYEIGNADLWYTIQVQLFEKFTNFEGKTVWNDLTQSKTARVSSLSPAWSDRDVSIRYQSSEWIPRAEFTLPVASLCLLAPTKNSSASTKNPIDKYIVVPREDIVGLRDLGNAYKRDQTSSHSEMTSVPNERPLRRVMIRTSRALFGGAGEKVSIVSKGNDQYLTLVHRQPYHAQIDLEARADGNQLVHVGTFGRVMTVVADNSRRTRTVLTVQATNTGLAAARFKVVAQDCNPELPELVNGNVNKVADNILLPPKQTQSIRLEVPVEFPVDVAHCSVALINSNDQTVAVRDVTVKKGDRCFCVWHCECVCLGEDSKLLCREMPEARQIAAGLTLRERTRHVRSVCYHDVVSLNLCITVLGVLFTLLMFGFLKAFLGLIFRCIGDWGLHHLVQMPRRLDHYYESSLSERKVVYDEEGWPVHPDTNKRSVRLISKSMEFVLNTIFFITAPSVITYNVMKQLFNRCKKSDGNGSNWGADNTTKNCFSSHDIQGHRSRLRRRRAKLQRWMSPEAEKLSSNLWQKGLPARASMITEYMRPLLHDECCRGLGEPATVQESCVDSEVDDTEYVLMQMQKSRESLARSRKKLNNSS